MSSDDESDTDNDDDDDSDEPQTSLSRNAMDRARLWLLPDLLTLFSYLLTEIARIPSAAGFPDRL